MPDALQELIYRRATRGQFALLIMLSGPAGVGKTMSALRLARGMAGSDGRVFVADTDNGRATLYADQFAFDHLDLHEPFRPKLFEDAAIAAQRQGAAVLVIDNFAHEHAGPGGVLEWHEEELTRLTKGDVSKRDSLNMLAWALVKPSHKHMKERLYQLNVPIILACSAERKIAMIKQSEGRDKGKVIPVEQGFQPICNPDIPYAMTVSLMLEDVARPGVPRPIKALLPALQSIIRLDQPLDEATGAQIGAWARGETGPADRAPAESTAKPAASSADIAPAHTGSAARKPPADDAQILEGAKALAAKFANTADRAEHLRLVDDPEIRRQIAWLSRNRKELFAREVDPFINASWARTAATQQTREQQDMAV